jgi:integrase
MGIWKALKNADGKGGVRYREHPTRKHGAVPDRYYALTYWWQGKTMSEKVGWASEGWTPTKCFDLLGQIRHNQATHEGPCTLAELRQEEDSKKEMARKERDSQAKLDISFKVFFGTVFFPDAKAGWSNETARKAEEHVRNWIHPVTGDTPMRELDLSHVQKIKANLATAPFPQKKKKSSKSGKLKKKPVKSEKGNRAGRSARQMQYVFRTFSQVWNVARDMGIVDKPSPTAAKSFKLPNVDNERQRYLTLEEEMRLLDATKARSHQAHDMALVSIDGGLRFKEVARLPWGWVDLDTATLKVIDSKGRDRYVPMTGRLVELFKGMEKGGPSTLAFPDSRGGVQRQIPSSFTRAVKDAGLNEGVENQKMKASFHSLRHTFASRMVQSGVDLYKVQRLLGHSTPVMTARYSKLADGDLRKAVEAMEQERKIKESNGKVVHLRKKTAEQ